MAKSKIASKKKNNAKSRGVDFKKVKRKLGRKLPPPKNTTNTEIKSKAIVLPEQSVAADKTGLAVNKKGLTLKELLQQTSHHNAKIRKDALFGLKDLFNTHPLVLKEHKYAVIEKLSERFVDDDKVVRDTLYQSFKAIILPACKEENQGPMVSLMMPFVFMAMTHLANDVRLMAFKFLDIIVHFHPASFFLHSEKVLKKFEDVLRRNQLQEKGKLKAILSSLVGCLLLLPQNPNTKNFGKNALESKLLHIYEEDDTKSFVDYSLIVKNLRTLLPALVDCLRVSIPNSSAALDSLSLDYIRSLLQSINLTIGILKNYIFKKILRFDQFSKEYEMSIWHDEIAPVLLKKLFTVFPIFCNDEGKYFLMNSDVAEIFLLSNECLDSPIPLFEKFFFYIEGVFLGSGKNSRERLNHVISLIYHVPKLIHNLSEDWLYRLINAFTCAFNESHPESSTKMACLKAMKEMLSPKEDSLLLFVSNPNLLNQMVSWVRTLPDLLLHVQEKSPYMTKLTLEILLSFGQTCAINPLSTQCYSCLQNPFQKFFSVSNCNGIFINLPEGIQELAISCLSYFPKIDSSTLCSLASSCLSNKLDPLISTRIISAMESAHLSGRLCVANYINFVVTIICRFSIDCDRKSSKIITREICLSLSRIGDKSLLLRMVEKLVIPELATNTSLASKCGIFRILNTLNSSPSMFSHPTIGALGSQIPGYLIHVVEAGVDKDDVGLRYYLVPCHNLVSSHSELFNIAVGHSESTGSSDCKLGDAVSALLLACNDRETFEISPQFYSLMDRLRSFVFHDSANLL